MIVQPTNVEKLKDMFLELFLASTNKVTKVSAGSVMNAVGFGVGKVAQKVQKDIAIIESNIFPEAAFGTLLDNIATRNGVSARFGANESTTYLRLVGDPGTTYLAATHTFTGKQGIVFELTDDVTIGVEGFTYAKVRSTTQGSNANVDPLTITQVLPAPPTGHDFVINEYKAIQGRDDETDDLFRIRIEEGVNILAESTLSRYEQAFMKINENVLRVYKGGFTNDGKLRLVVSTVNGTDLTANELTDLRQQAYDFLGVTDQIAGIEIANIEYFPVDISMRVELTTTADADAVRIDMQTRMQKIVDWRFWEFGNVIEYEDFIVAAKKTPGISRILDGFFFPSADITPPTLTLPRIRGFLLLDINGAIISDSGGALNPVFYPNQPDFGLQSTVLASI